MSQAVEDSLFPMLFVHQLRQEWGVSVMSGEHDGKRRYLFEGGEERTMSAGALDLMRRVEHPDQEQQAAYARLTALLAKRGGRTKAPVNTGHSAIAAQLSWFRERYPKGLLDEKWLADGRREKARRARTAAIAKGQDLLSKKNLEAHAAVERYDTIWKDVLAVLAESGLVDVDKIGGQLSTEQVGSLGRAVRKLLHGTTAYEQRFDGFVAAFDTVFRSPPHWELATALPAIVYPTEHTVVELPTFRKQLKAVSRNSVLGTRPGGTAYARCAAMARTIAADLAKLGEVPRDLFDVFEFVNATILGVGKPNKAE